MRPELYAVLEALADGRIAGEDGLVEDELWAETGADLRGQLDATGLVERRSDRIVVAADARAELDAFASARAVEWATATTTQGELLAAFTAHCRDELDDVDVLWAEEAPDGGVVRLRLRWRREEARIEARTGFLFCARLAGEPTLLLGDLDLAGPRLVDAFVADAGLRAKIALYDLARLEKVSAVKAPVFVHLEWFLRDAHGVKLVPSGAFTQGLVQAGVISLGFG